MSTLSPNVAVTVATTLFAGLAMLQIGLRKRTIRWRILSRCPSCGIIRRSANRCDRCAS